MTLIQAVINQNFEQVQAFLASGEALNHQNKNGNTALMLACYETYHSERIAEALIKAGAKLNLQNKAGDTALLIAVQAEVDGYNPSIDIAQALIEAGADVNIRNKSRDTALMIVLETGYDDIDLALINAGADVNFHDDGDTTALMSTLQQCHPNLEVITALINKGVNLNAQDGQGNTALITALEWRHMAEASCLIGAGSDLNLQNNAGDTALHRAIHQKEGARIAIDLINANAHVNTQNKYGDTALMIAAGSEENPMSVVQVLLKANADVNTQNAHGHTALMCAAERGHISIVRTLLESGADVDLVNQEKKTACDLCCRFINDYKGVTKKIRELLLMASAKKALLALGDNQDEDIDINDVVSKYSAISKETCSATAYQEAQFELAKLMLKAIELSDDISEKKTLREQAFYHAHESEDVTLYSSIYGNLCGNLGLDVISIEHIEHIKTIPDALIHGVDTIKSQELKIAELEEQIVALKSQIDNTEKSEPGSKRSFGQAFF